MKALNEIISYTYKTELIHQVSNTYMKQGDVDNSGYI
jgi:hypothetical protein